MLAIIWWGLCGFLAFLAGLWAFLDGIGPTGRLVVFALAGILGQHMLARYLTADERCANDFLAAWQAASAGYPDGRMDTPEMTEFVDGNRIGPIDGELADRLRLVRRPKVRKVGEEDTAFDGQDGKVVVPAEVFASDCAFVVMEDRLNTEVKLWVSRRNHLVVRVSVAGVDLGDRARERAARSEAFAERLSSHGIPVCP
jgi:hypothetical protein